MGAFSRALGLLVTLRETVPWESWVREKMSESGGVKKLPKQGSERGRIKGNKRTPSITR